MQFVEIDQFARHGAKRNRAVIVLFGTIQLRQNERVFVYVIQTQCGFPRYTRSSVHFGAGDRHHATHELRLEGRCGQQRRNQER